MDHAKKKINELKLMLSEAVMGEDSVLSLPEIKKAFNILKEIEADIGRNKREVDILKIPKLPKGAKHNPYPRMIYAIICELYTRDKFYTIRDLMAFTGMSRNQVKNDMDRLEDEGFIKLIDGYVGERSTHFYKHKPTYL